MTRKNKLTLALALIAGIAFVVIMVKLKQPPERGEAQATATPVRIMEITPRKFRTEARGYGQVLPARSWNAVAKDRKSTRLNSSHVRISYAVLCLKQKNKY